MRKITVSFTVEDEQYPRVLELVATSLFSGNPWIPGFLFQHYFKGFALHLDNARVQAVVNEGSDQ